MADDDSLADRTTLMPLPGPATSLATLDAATLAPGELAAALRFAAAAKAAHTRRAYAADWADFCRWAASRGAEDPLPCPPGLLCGYLAALADTGRQASTIARRAAAIAHHHRAAGFDPPTANPAVRAVLRGIRHTHGTAPAGKTPATADLIARMLTACPDTLIGRRDRALIAVGFAGAFRRSELLALAVADLTAMPDGLRVLIRRSKTDPAAQGQEIAIPRGTNLRPVETLQAWLAAAAISDGPLFRPVGKGGTVGPFPLGADGFVRALKRRAAAAGLDPAGVAGHSLRAGFLTSAAEAGADALKMAEVSRHKSLDTLRRYVRRANLFKAHAGADFL